jgi:hypothetical protein
VNTPGGGKSCVKSSRWLYIATRSERPASVGSRRSLRHVRVP